MKNVNKLSYPFVPFSTDLVSPPGDISSMKSSGCLCSQMALQLGEWLHD